MVALLSVIEIRSMPRAPRTLRVTFVTVPEEACKSLQLLQGITLTSHLSTSFDVCSSLSTVQEGSQLW